jgi:single-strand DNA-binding protein
MAIDNTVTIAGNLTRDPEIKFLKSGTAVTELSVAINRKDKEGEDHTSFVDVKAWQSLAENASESLTKGMRVVVSGRLEQETWEDKEGNKRSKLVVVADEISPSLRWATATATKAETHRQPAAVASGAGDPF